MTLSIIVRSRGCAVSNFLAMAHIGHVSLALETEVGVTLRQEGHFVYVKR